MPVDKLSKEFDTRTFKELNIDLMNHQSISENAFKSQKEIDSGLNKNIVLKALRSRGLDGATCSEIAEITKLSMNTSRKYLDDLCKIREAYKLKRGKQITIYYINGKPRHEYGFEKIEHDDNIFEFCLAEGANNRLLLHVIEKKMTLLDGEIIDGSVIIPHELIPDVIKKMKAFYEMAEKGRDNE
ncbi:MAG TPA: hypothetical protein DSN98_04830 [Thermoplasmata archaeon]|jgi:hypothetical protein|nr:MAG TPA: hypothetical protein DSN98_04830 [Thermoplasmata archaeon]